jgi:two-component system sensor kinase FixL
VVAPDAFLAGIVGGTLAGAIIAEEALSSFNLKALETAIQSQPPWSDFPIVVLTFKGMPPAVGALAIERLGHVSVLERPVHASVLSSAARGMLRTRARQLEAKEFLRQREEALANLQALNTLRDLFEKAPGCIAVTMGPEHRFEMANEAFRRAAGRDLIGLTVRQALPELVEQGFLQILDRVYETAEPFTAEELPVAISSSEGVPDQRFFALVYQPIFGPQGEVTGLFAEAFDVTSRKNAQDRVQTLQNELIHLSRMSAMGAMASTLAHELNQPLMAIVNYLRAGTRFLSDGGPEAIEQVDFAMRQAEQSAIRAGNVIRRARDMVTGSKANQEKQDLSPLVSEALEIATRGANEIGLVCRTEYKSGIAVVVDRVQIQQVVLNLVRNAVEAMEHLERKVLRVKTHLRGLTAEVVISDIGRGLNADVRDKLFTPFITSKDEGLGVGLSISRTIIEAHGGAIGARDRAGGGTEVWFTLPLADTSL